MIIKRAEIDNEHLLINIFEVQNYAAKSLNFNSLV